MDTPQFTYATADENSNDVDVAYFMSCSGGAFRGSIQFWVIVHLVARYWYTLISGVSVGSINGVCAAMHKLDVLYTFWQELDGRTAYLSHRWLYYLGRLTGIVWLLKKLGFSIMGGIYDMTPLHIKLKEHCHLKDLKVPFAAGVISMNSGVYYNKDSRDMKHDARLALCVLVSSCMAPFMKPPLIQLEERGEKEAGFDGGGRNIFPIPHEQMAAARATGKKIILHAIGCTPMERIHRVQTKKVDGEIEMALRGLEILEAEVFENDIEQLRKAVGPYGEVWLWVPAEHPGDSFDATAESRDARLAESRHMVERGPTVLHGVPT